MMELVKLIPQILRLFDLEMHIPAKPTGRAQNRDAKNGSQSEKETGTWNEWRCWNNSMAIPLDFYVRLKLR
jgi:hypothetical protein